MYGKYNLPLSLREKNVSIYIDKKDQWFQYLREIREEKVEKFLAVKECSILINPVEPLNTPKDLTPYLLIEFGRRIIIEPKGTCRIYLKFPAEIAVYSGKFGKRSKQFHIIDIFSFDPGKYYLYGDIRTGILCKYYKSDVFMVDPGANPLVNGIMELTILNKNVRWVEISGAVFNAYLMKIYYNKDKIGLKASMLIIDRDIAETSFLDSPLEKGMKKAVKNYVPRSIIMTSSSFIMEWGYDFQL